MDNEKECGSDLLGFKRKLIADLKDKFGECKVEGFKITFYEYGFDSEDVMVLMGIDIEAEIRAGSIFLVPLDHEFCRVWTLLFLPENKILNVNISYAQHR